jgi:DNA-binding Lrp family transcriptional regulator
VTTGPGSSGSWTFLTNHSHVLICITRDPEILMRELAELVGITERAVQSIVADLEAAGYLSRERVGRRNRYHVQPDHPMRHPVESGHEVRAMLEAFVTQPAPPAR